MTERGAIVPVAEVNPILTEHHYLGAISRGIAYRDAVGVLVFANPSSRRLPPHRWKELVRWCIIDRVPNAGSSQWARAIRALQDEAPLITTVVSYSDPSVGHDGALYRASNWLWAPTWHRLRPPPSGHGDWGTGAQAVKDRWVFPLLPDDERESLLIVKDDSILRRMPWASYREPEIRRGRVIRGTGGADYLRWRALTNETNQPDPAPTRLGATIPNPKDDQPMRNRP